MNAPGSWSLPFHFGQLRWNLFLKLREQTPPERSALPKQLILLLCSCAAGTGTMLLESAFLPGSTAWSAFCLGCALCYFFAVLLLSHRFPVAGSETGDFLPGDLGAALLLLLAFLCGCWSFF